MGNSTKKGGESYGVKIGEIAPKKGESYWVKIEEMALGLKKEE